jgi:hypothetical protein
VREERRENRRTVTGVELSEVSALVVDVKDVGQVGVNSELKSEGGLREGKESVSAEAGEREEMIESSAPCT